MKWNSKPLEEDTKTIKNRFMNAGHIKIEEKMLIYNLEKVSSSFIELSKPSDVIVMGLHKLDVPANSYVTGVNTWMG